MLAIAIVSPSVNEWGLNLYATAILIRLRIMTDKLKRGNPSWIDSHPIAIQTRLIAAIWSGSGRAITMWALMWIDTSEDYVSRGMETQLWERSIYREANDLDQDICGIAIDREIKIKTCAIVIDQRNRNQEMHDRDSITRMRSRYLRSRRSGSRYV